MVGLIYSGAVNTALFTTGPERANCVILSKHHQSRVKWPNGPLMLNLG